MAGFSKGAGVGGGFEPPRGSGRHPERGVILGRGEGEGRQGRFPIGERQATLNFGPLDVSIREAGHTLIPYRREKD